VVKTVIGMKVTHVSDVAIKEWMHGKAIDQDLAPDFWITQPEKVMFKSRADWLPPRVYWHYETLDLRVGSHTIVYGNSAPSPGHRFDAEIYVDGELVAKGEAIHADNPLEGAFWVGPTPGLVGAAILLTMLVLLIIWQGW